MDETEKKKIEPSIKPLRTYATDMADVVQDGQASVVRVAMAEAQKREANKENVSPQSGRNIRFIILGILLLCIGAGIVLYVFYKKTAPLQTTAPQTSTSSLIFSDKTQIIDITDKNRDQIVKDIQYEIDNRELRLGDIAYLYFTEKNGVDYITIPFTDWLSRIGATPPEGLARNFGAPFMFGMYSSAGNVPFLLVKTTTYNNGYAGMLAWEGKLLDDLYQMFGIVTTGDNAVLFEKGFEDKIIENKDARVLYAPNGDVVLLYVFIDDTTVLIAKDRLTVKEVLSRFVSGRK
jgi:hypothetical protein